MKFIVSSSALLKQLQHIGGVINANNVLPILEDFLFQVEKGTLWITATDLETVMKVQLEVEARESGKICIPARILQDYLKNNPDQPLTFSMDLDSYAIEITSDNGRYKIVGENPSNFPKEPEADEKTSFQMSAEALSTAIAKTLFAVSNDDLRPAMTGVYFELSPTGLNFVSTDAHRLVKYSRSDVACPREDHFIVPKKPLNLLKGVLPSDDSQLSVSYSESHLFLQHRNTELICRLIDARFPDYRVVMPANNPYRLVLNRSDFQSALRRVSVFSNKSTNHVVLTITGSELQLNAQDIDFSFEGNERMRCQFKGDDMQIAFNGKFLAEMMQVMDCEEVEMELAGPTKAGIIKPIDQQEGEELTMLTMPLMINA